MLKNWTILIATICSSTDEVRGRWNPFWIPPNTVLNHCTIAFSHTDSWASIAWNNVFVCLRLFVNIQGKRKRIILTYKEKNITKTMQSLLFIDSDKLHANMQFTSRIRLTFAPSSSTKDLVLKKGSITVCVWVRSPVRVRMCVCVYVYVYVCVSVCECS